MLGKELFSKDDAYARVADDNPFKEDAKRDEISRAAGELPNFPQSKREPLESMFCVDLGAVRNV